jgi:large subunit ribosomal protein L1
MAEAKKTTKTKTVPKATKEATLVVEILPEKARAKTSRKSIIKEAIKEVKEIDNGNTQENSQSNDQEVTDRRRVTEQETTAKAGKRSAKALKAAEEAAEKEARKATPRSEPAKSKPAAKPARSRLERRGKKFREAAKQINSSKLYGLKDAVELAAKTSPVTFDASVELHINLAVDPRQADQNVRGTLVLPAGTGKTVRIAVFAEGDDAAAAKKAGAHIVGIEDVGKLLEKNQLDFDTLIATPSQMAKLGKYARVLGPHGLMPNPKSGTVTTDVAKAVTEAKGGKVEFRVDSTGILHMSVGKVSFGPEKLLDNVQAILAYIRSNKPASVKSTYLKTMHLTTSMGPSIRVVTD